MTGADHYREAERLLLSCQITSADKDNPAIYPTVEYDEEIGRPLHTTSNALIAAQVHATLALAAAQSVTNDTALLCPHGALPCAVCLHDLVADRMAGRA